MKRTRLIIALALLLTAQTAAKADSRIARFCGPDHVNEAASQDDVRPNPAGYYVASLREQVSEGDPRIVLTTSDDSTFAPDPAATPDMDSVEGAAADARTHREVPLRASPSARHTLVILTDRPVVIRVTLHR